MVPTGIVPSAKLQSSSSRRLPLNLQYPPTSSLRAMKPTDPIQITQLEHGTKLQKGDLWTFLDATDGEPATREYDPRRSLATRRSDPKMSMSLFAGSTSSDLPHY